MFPPYYSIVLKAYNISSLLQYCAKSNTMFPFYYSVMLQAYNVLFLLQCCATSIQCSYGLYNSSHIDVELWCGWYGLYSLEGTTVSTTGLSYSDISINGIDLHQIFTRLDYMGPSRCNGGLG